ncbi:MAG: FecR domain-containing protein [Polyangiaceae bacterium]
MVPIEPFEELGRHVAREQADLIGPGKTHERTKAMFLARLRQRRPAKRRGRRDAVFLAAAAVALALVVAYVSLPSQRDLKCFVGIARLPVAVGAWMSAPATAPLEIRFSDGTKASLWPEARGRVIRLSPHGADLVVEQGRASFDVVHQVAGHWQVSTGPFAVQITGTRFDVEWQPEKDRFELSLYDGHVRITGCALGGGQELGTGQRLEASCARKEFRISKLVGEASPVARVVAPAGVDSATPPELQTKLEAFRADLAQVRPEQHANQRSVSVTAAGERASDSWSSLARAGKFEEAYRAASALGFEAECLTRDVTEVLLLGDAARLSGHVDEALAAYQAVRQRWPGSANGALAAFQMGRAEFDQRRNYAAAERWLRVYMTELPNAEFAAPALGRLMEAEVRLGRYESARDLAKSYLDRYPKGSHVDAANQVLGASSAHSN